MHPFIAIAAALCLGLFSVFDYLVSLSRLDKYGTGVERGRITRFLTKRLGAPIGMALGIIGVSFLILSALIALNWDHALAAFLGARALFFVIQGKSLQVEREIEREILRNVS